MLMLILRGSATLCGILVHLLKIFLYWTFQWRSHFGFVCNSNFDSIVGTRRARFTINHYCYSYIVMYEINFIIKTK